MSGCRRMATLSGILVTACLAAAPAIAGEDYGIGRAATAAEIAGWDIDVRPDGVGLPPGRGAASEGEAIYDALCAGCHGGFGEGVGRYPALMGEREALRAERPLRTVGNYWPFAAPLWDYIRRTMPFGDAQSLSADETYAVTAYVLYLNGIIEEGAVLDRASLPAVVMPNRDGFLSPDPRPDVAAGEPCMRGCKAAVEVTERAKSLGVTPGSGEEAQ